MLSTRLTNGAGTTSLSWVPLAAARWHALAIASTAARVCVTRRSLCPIGLVRAGDPCSCPDPGCQIDLSKRPVDHVLERQSELAGASQVGIFVDATVEPAMRATVSAVTAVTRVNGLPIGDGSPGPVYRRLLAAWSEEVGLEIADQIQEGARRA
jgi:hypothetical protein